jgi:hypothetical protein
VGWPIIRGWLCLVCVVRSTYKNFLFIYLFIFVGGWGVDGLILTRNLLVRKYLIGFFASVLGRHITKCKFAYQGNNIVFRFIIEL